MPRLPRIVVPGHPHHVTQRGNQKRTIYRDGEDRQVYLRLIRRSCQRYAIDVQAYCLMANHMHLVASPRKGDSLGKGLRDAHGLYALYFNRKYDSVGHLWQSRYFSCVLDEPHLWSALRYVEQNPVRAGVVKRAEHYPWSSAPAHCGFREDPLLSNFKTAHAFDRDWSSWLAGEPSPAELRLVREKTQTGRPWGSEAFVRLLETKLDRRLRPRKRGPKRKCPKSGTK